MKSYNFGAFDNERSTNPTFRARGHRRRGEKTTARWTLKKSPQHLSKRSSCMVSLSAGRYGNAHEYEAMAAMVEGVSHDLRLVIESIWCDSKANACYSVCLRPCATAQAREIGRQIEGACIEHEGGHNGIYIQGAQSGQLDIDLYWAGDDI